MPHCSLLLLPSGCGNSSMSGDMYGAGYRSITNIDYSSVCISAMADRYSDCPGMTWHQMDVRQLCFPSASFDVILEKATLDAIMVEEKSPWDVSPQTACFIHQALTEVPFKSLCPHRALIFCRPRNSHQYHFQFSWWIAAGTSALCTENFTDLPLNLSQPHSSPAVINHDDMQCMCLNF